MIYFDNAATTYPKPDCVYKAIEEGMRKYSFNAGRGSYLCSSNTYKMIDETREKLASLIGANKSQVIFSSSATESLNNIINGLCLKEGDNVYVTPFEHNAVIRPLYDKKVNILIIPFDKKTWKLDYNNLNDMFLLKKPKSIIISHISNVTGYLIPYKEIFELGKKHNSINVLDSSQGFGIYPIDKQFCDYIIFAGHKSLYSMFGIAGYFKLGNDFLHPYKIGGTGSDSLNLEMPENLPNRYEAGSLNSVGIYSINQAIDFIKKSNFAKIKHDLTEYLINKLKEISEMVLFLPDGYVSNGIVSFALKGYKSDDIGIVLAQDYDICVRTGYHCAPLVHDFIESKAYAGTVRVSLSGFNTINDVDCLVNSIREMI